METITSRQNKIVREAASLASSAGHGGNFSAREPVFARTQHAPE